MSIAYKAAVLVTSYCIATFPDKGAGMASTMCDNFMDLFECSYGSHKYIAADELTEALGEPAGAGVFGFYRFKDGSSILLTCKGPLATLDEKGARWSEVKPLPPKD